MSTSRRAPDLKLDIKRPLDAGQKTFWAPVGDIALWRGEDGRWSGKARIYALDGDLNVFEYTPREERPEPKTPYRGERHDPQQQKILGPEDTPFGK